MARYPTMNRVPVWGRGVSSVKAIRAAKESRYQAKWSAEDAAIKAAQGQEDAGWQAAGIDRPQTGTTSAGEPVYASGPVRVPTRYGTALPPSMQDFTPEQQAGIAAGTLSTGDARHDSNFMFSAGQPNGLRDMESNIVKQFGYGSKEHGQFMADRRRMMPETQVAAQTAPNVIGAGFTEAQADAKLAEIRKRGLARRYGTPDGNLYGPNAMLNRMQQQTGQAVSGPPKLASETARRRWGLAQGATMNDVREAYLADRRRIAEEQMATRKRNYAMRQIGGAARTGRYRPVAATAGYYNS